MEENFTMIICQVHMFWCGFTVMCVRRMMWNKCKLMILSFSFPSEEERGGHKNGHRGTSLCSYSYLVS